MYRLKLKQFWLNRRQVKMYSEVFGYRVNLIHVVVIVAFYDLVHILYEFKQRFDVFEQLENDDMGCLGDAFQAHCVTIFSELAIYTIDFIFTGFLIYGVSLVRDNYNQLELNEVSVKFNQFDWSWNCFRCYVGLFFHLITWLISSWCSHLSTTSRFLRVGSPFGCGLTLVKPHNFSIFQSTLYWTELNLFYFIGGSILGFFFVVFYFRKLVEVKRGGIERERLSNVDELNITGVEMEV